MRIVVVVCASLAGVAGCATLLGIDSDRHLAGAGGDGAGPTEDAGPPPGEDAGPFGCLNNPPPPVPDASLEILWFFNNAADIPTTATGNNAGPPIPGLTIHACATLDPGCMSPLTANATTDDAGLVLLKGIPPAFTGYYELQAPGFNNTLLSRPPEYHSEYQSQALAPADLIAAGGSFVGITQDPNLAFAVVAAFDCDTSATGSTPAGGIEYDLTGTTGQGEQVVYLVKNTPSLSATQTDSTSGTAIIFNIPVQDAGVSSVAFNAIFAATGEAFQQGIIALVRQNWITYVNVKPSQAAWTPIPDQ